MSENNQNAQDLSDAINTSNNDSTSASSNTQGSLKWLDSLPEDLKGVKSLSKFNDLTSLAKSYVELERSMDKKIIMPSDDASEEEWNKYYIKLGMPEDRKYISAEIRSKLLGENAADEETLNLYEELFAQGSLSRKQGEKLLNKIIENAKSSTEELTLAQGKIKESNMNSFYESHKDKASEKLNILKGVMSQYGSKELVDLVEANNYSPVLIDLLLRLGEGVKGDSLVSGKSEVNVSDKESARKEIKRLESDEAFMVKYRDKKHVGHKEAVSSLGELYAAAYKE